MRRRHPAPGRSPEEHQFVCRATARAPRGVHEACWPRETVDVGHGQVVALPSLASPSWDVSVDPRRMLRSLFERRQYHLRFSDGHSSQCPVDSPRRAHLCVIEQGAIPALRAASCGEARSIHPPMGSLQMLLPCESRRRNHLRRENRGGLRSPSTARTRSDAGSCASDDRCGSRRREPSVLTGTGKLRKGRGTRCAGRWRFRSGAV